MTSERDGHIHVLPLHVANQIAAGEVVERPASVVKELVENAIDAGATEIAVHLSQGGVKSIAVQDNGSGMTREDALLCLERQATSKILSADDIRSITTLGFRGEAIPSIASVSRFVLTTRRRESDEGTCLHVDAGTLADVASAGCPPGTRVEVRDLFCNIPARRKFLKSRETEESHVRSVLTTQALAHPAIALSLTIDGREAIRLAPAAGTLERIRDIFGAGLADRLVEISGEIVSGYVEKPGFDSPTRGEQFIFINGRPATAPTIAYALKEGFPRRQGDARPSVFLFLTLPAADVDVNVHPAKREVRFRNNQRIREAIITALTTAFSSLRVPAATAPEPSARPTNPSIRPPNPSVYLTNPPVRPVVTRPVPPPAEKASSDVPVPPPKPDLPAPAPIVTELPMVADETENAAKPWVWFKFLAMTDSGYLLIETDTGVVTINPHAARERIAYERLLANGGAAVQQLLIPETVRLSPTDFARLGSALPSLQAMGFALEAFGRDTYKIDAVPQLIGELSPGAVLTTIAHDLAEGGVRRGGAKWREELIARAIARSFAGMSLALDERGAVKLVEELAATRMPYVCPRAKPIMIFTSTRELNRKFSRE